MSPKQPPAHELQSPPPARVVWPCCSKKSLCETAECGVETVGEDHVILRVRGGHDEEMDKRDGRGEWTFAELTFHSCSRFLPFHSSMPLFLSIVTFLFVNLSLNPS
jgi:hypothetical protein